MAYTWGAPVGQHSRIGDDHPDNYQPEESPVTVAKALVQLLMTVLAAVIPALTVGPLTPAAWVNIVILAAGVVMVYNAANIPGWSWAKLIASGISAVAVVLASALTAGHGLGPVEYIQMALAAAAALGVGAIPNGGTQPVAA